MKLTSKRIEYRVYEVKVNGKTFEIDGQNYEGDTNEWELFEVEYNVSKYQSEKRTQCDVFDTKRDAMEWLEGDV